MRLPATLRRVLDSDLWWSFRRSPVTVVAAVVALMIIGGALFAPWIAPHDPYDPASLSLLDASNPPAWLDGGSWTYPLGTDNQGRDVLSAILYGSRLSLFVGSSAVAPGDAHRGDAWAFSPVGAAASPTRSSCGSPTLN